VKGNVMKKLFIVFVLLFLIFSSCQERSLSPSDKNQNGFGEISFKMSMANAPFDVVDIRGFLNRVSYDTIYFNFTINNDSAFALVNNIVSGQWQLTVNAYNINNDIIYSGSTDVVITPGITTPVYLRLDPVTGSLQVIVTWGSVDSTLLGYYPFNGNANDESGNGNNGTVLGAVLTHDRFGNPNSAYSFDGIDDYINMGNHAILKPQLPATISLWIKPAITGRNHILTTNYNYMHYFGFFFLVYNDGRLRIAYGDGGGIGAYSSRSKYSISTLTANNWYHLVGVFRGPTDMDIYINGENNGGTYAGYGSGVFYDFGDMNLGRHDTAQHNPPQYFNGVMDDVRFFNYDLSQQEVLALYNE
jgi:hypothetical protein